MIIFEFIFEDSIFWNTILENQFCQNFLKNRNSLISSIPITHRFTT